MCCDWVGTGELQCYGHVSTAVSTPPGGDYLERGQLTCNPAEWDFDTGLGPEAMFFKPQTSAEFEIWAVILTVLFFLFSFAYSSGTTTALTSPGLSVMETSGTSKMTWEPGIVYLT